MHNGVLTCVINSYIFHVSLTVFQEDFPEFSLPLIIFHTFQNLENFSFKFHDFQAFPSICINPEDGTAVIVLNFMFNSPQSGCVKRRWFSSCTGSASAWSSGAHWRLPSHASHTSPAQDTRSTRPSRLPSRASHTSPARDTRSTRPSITLHATDNSLTGRTADTQGATTLPPGVHQRFFWQKLSSRVIPRQKQQHPA